MNRRLIAAVMTVGITGGFVRPSIAADPPPATRPSITTKELDGVYAEINKTLLDGDTLADPAARAQAAPTAVPLLKKMIAGIDQVGTLPDTDPADMPRIRNQFVVWAAACGDTDSAAALQKLADSKSPAESVMGKAGQLSVQWITGVTDPKSVADVARKISDLAKSNSDSKDVMVTILPMIETCPDQPEVFDQLVGALSTMKAQGASMIAAQVREQSAAEKRLAAAWENRPIEIKGKTPEGKDFSTADLKGKVVLVDFWATWCPPCRAELPHVKKIYAQYKDKGLEILGVSNDEAADDLKKFLADDKQMPWPQLFDGVGPNGGLGSIAREYGIGVIPTMFLIDKKGILRTVRARHNMAKIIPQLLDEK